MARREIVHTEPMPNIFQGHYRITRENWWAKASALNSAICLCKCDWLAFVDDRCVLVPTWLGAVKEAMAGNYAMAGAYERRFDLKVENGYIVDWGKLDSSDSRSPGGKDHREILANGAPQKCPGGWWFGANNAMPLEWLLQLNGYPTKTDSVSHEDSIFGIVMENAGFDIRYDPRAKVILDRTPDQLGTPMKRSSKEKHPHDTNDKTHILLRWSRTAKRSVNDFDIRELRDEIQSGRPWHVPIGNNQKDWFDQTLIRDF